MHNVTTIKVVVMFLLSATLLVSTVHTQADEMAVSEPPKTLYVIPFLNAMIPDVLSSSLFDSFIDQVMSSGAQQGLQIRILKQDVDAIDKSWLAQQSFLTGEVFGYQEESGCCSTAIEVSARIYSYRPGSVDPKRVIVVTDEVFFEHDVATLEKERMLLAERIARKLSGQFLPELLSQ